MNTPTETQEPTTETTPPWETECITPCDDRLARFFKKNAERTKEPDTRAVLET